MVLGGMGICVLWEGSLTEEYGPRHLEDALEDSHGRQSSPVLNHRCPGRGNMSPIRGHPCPSQPKIGPRS